VSALFEKLAGAVERVVGTLALPALPLETAGWLQVTTSVENPPNGIYAVREVTLLIEGAGLEVRFGFGPVVFNLNAWREAAYYALVWDQRSLMSVVGRMTTDNTFGFALPLTTGEVLEHLVEEET
jgi:hypothetical protein